MKRLAPLFLAFSLLSPLPSQSTENKDVQRLSSAEVTDRAKAIFFEATKGTLSQVVEARGGVDNRLQLLAHQTLSYESCQENVRQSDSFQRATELFNNNLDKQVKLGFISESDYQFYTDSMKRLSVETEDRFHQVTSYCQVEHWDRYA